MNVRRSGFPGPDIVDAMVNLQASCESITGAKIGKIPSGFSVTVDGMAWPVLHMRTVALARKRFGDNAEMYFDFD